MQNASRPPQRGALTFLRRHLVDLVLLTAVSVTAIRAVRARLPKIERLSQSDWQAISHSGSMAPTGSVLVEFSDYQCPYCARVEQEVFSGALLDSLHIRRVIIRRDVALGRQVGVLGTPTLFLNGIKVPSLPPALSAYLRAPRTRLRLADVGSAVAALF